MQRSLGRCRFLICLKILPFQVLLVLFSSSFDLPLPTPRADTNSKQHSHDLNSAGHKLAKCSHMQRVSAFLQQSLTALHGDVQAHPQTGLSKIGFCAWAHRHLRAHTYRACEKNCTYTYKTHSATHSLHCRWKMPFFSITYQLETAGRNRAEALHSRKAVL